ncbi:hypothetical protein B0G69_7981 [Paraburkholderia sp. RAU2J]|uniref:pYEATS domain-containing protein n=1 Tax=Paraburkholderia sp. RAU2J TaxID=1938810 RepID=UPI000EB3425A|nr:pYEATS domain-containing protein [Paraburkholderia sp. RAU2J]RKT10553.1 hypothetical protein B0G69_7981 [Paraburkholderia sp. RAU2J]
MDSRETHEAKDKSQAQDRQRKASRIVACGIVLVFLLLLVPPSRMTGVIGQVVTGLIWPIFLLVVIVLYQPHVERLFHEVAERIKQGSGISVGNWVTLEKTNIPAAAQRIPAPTEEQSVTLENIALLHTSFFSEKGTRKHGQDGRLYYQFEVVVMAPDVVMGRVERVEYHLEKAWPPENREHVSEDRASRFKMKDLANGTSIVVADVFFRGDDHPLKLNRFIDLRPDGPRI